MINTKIAIIRAVALAVVLSLSSHAVSQIELNVYKGILIEYDQRTPNISTNEMRVKLSDNTTTVLDVRTPMEYAIGHIPGTINVAGKPGATREEFTSDVDEIGRLVNQDKAASIVLYCAGPYCGKSSRVAEQLYSLGYTNVSRYQLGIPVWRALGELTAIAAEGIKYVLERDRTAVLVDARDVDQFSSGTVANARNIPAIDIESDIYAAKQDGRLPMEDHNTRIIVIGMDGSQARTVAHVLTRNAFHNVSYYDGTFEELKEFFAN